MKVGVKASSSEVSIASLIRFIYARATGIDDEGTIFGIATIPDGFSLRPFLLVRNGGD